MDQNELIRRIMATFLEELDEHVATLNRDLLALEKDPPPEERVELLHSLFRAAHSMKGASRAVDVGLIEQACHALEDLLVQVRDGKRQLQENHFTVLFRLADAIEEAGMRLREEQSLDDSPIAALLPEIQALDNSDEFPSPAAEATETEQAVDDADRVVADKAPTQLVTPPQSAGSAESSVPAVGPAAADGRKGKQKAPRKRQTSAGPVAPTSVRIDAEKLDGLLAQAGELLVARQRIELGVEELESLRDTVAAWRRDWRSVETSIRQLHDGEEAASGSSLSKAAFAELHQSSDRIRELERDLDRLVGRARSDAQYLGQVGSAIEDDVHGARMLPFANACQGLERAIRDAATKTGKHVRLALLGGDVQVDRSVLEGLKDPLLHLVRNAVDHGIETPAERASSGKSEEATITIEAALRGGSVNVSVRDNGGGLNLQRIAEKAAANGIAVPQDPQDLARIIFLPAFSTAAKVSDLSGRGVGLDVVRSQIEHLHGTVDLSFQAGCWTCFTLTVPLTLTTIRAVMVKTSGQTFAIPTVSIERVVRFDETDHASVGGRSVLRDGEAPIALTSLAATLGLRQKWALLPDQKMFAAVMMSGSHRAAFAVDEVASEVELTVKSLGPRVRRLKHVSGATLMPSGEIALVLNVANLMRTAAGSGQQFSVAEAKTAADELPDKRRLLVVEDSLTSRMLLRSILDAAGYTVSVAVDGQQALEMVGSTPFDLVVSDVDMPRLDGFGFTEEVRKVSDHSHLPIVLITARSSEEDRIRGLKAGANAYLVKSGFDQARLLQIISDLL